MRTLESNGDALRNIMTRQVVTAGAFLCVALLSIGTATAADRTGGGTQSSTVQREAHLDVPLPPGFRIVNTELDGPVFADARGLTLYYWPQTTMRNGITGDPKNDSVCTDVATTKTGGLMSPYPPGLILPELDKRKSCAAVWPPALAAEDAKPVGDFTIFTRKDGRKQWAYDEHALYTSALDRMPGDVMGASTRKSGGDGPAAREVAMAPSAIPPGFYVATTALGRQLLTDKHYSIYSSDADGADRSNCDAACART